MNKFIFPIILIILSVGLFIVYIQPTDTDIKSLKDTKKQYDEALNKSKELRTVRDSLLEKYNSFSQSDLERIEKLLPDNVDNVRLIMDINNIASKYGALIRDIRVTSIGDASKETRVRISNTEKYEKVTLSFSLSASYSNFIKFVADLRDSLRLVDITNLEFTSADQDGGEVYKYNFTINTYRLK